MWGGLEIRGRLAIGLLDMSPLPLKSTALRTRDYRTYLGSVNT